jgi:hypothetical protein
MRTQPNKERYERDMARFKHNLNPCPGRSDSQRSYIARRLVEINSITMYHCDMTEGRNPKWLPEAQITPEMEATYVDTLDAYKDGRRDEWGYLLDMHDHNRRATNRIRVATWYRSKSSGDLYMAPLIAVSPLPCEEWGALPLTLAQWRVVMPSLIRSHIHWKWLHTVRDYLGDPTMEVGGSFGWHMEKCGKLIQDHAELCTGQAIYSHVIKAYLEHAHGT